MPQVDGNEKAKRANILNEINLANQREFRSQRITKVDEVLCEETFTLDGKEYYTGYTKEYVKIAVLKDRLNTNDIIKGKVVKFLTDDILLMEKEQNNV